MSKYKVEYAKSGRAKCSKCKQTIDKDVLRVGALVAGVDFESYKWCHFDCWKVPKSIDTVADIAGVSDLNPDDRQKIASAVDIAVKARGAASTKPAAAAAAAVTTGAKKRKADGGGPASAAKTVHRAGGDDSDSTVDMDFDYTPWGGPARQRSPPPPAPQAAHHVSPAAAAAAAAVGPAHDTSGSFREWQTLVKAIAAESAHTAKTSAITSFAKTFQGDLYLLVRLLLPGDDKRVYHVRAKQIVKVLSACLSCPLDDMVTDLSFGDTSETAKKFFLKYGHPKHTSTLTLAEVDQFLSDLVGATRDEEQQRVWSRVLARATPDDLKWFVRLVEHDLKVNVGAKFVLNALHPSGYDAYRKTNNLRAIVDLILSNKDASVSKSFSGAAKMAIQATVSLMTPVKPMLARACGSVEEAVKRCPFGMYCETKYDGERIQIHKSGTEFKFFSRNLKVFDAKKARPLADLPASIAAAIDAHSSVILDGEVVLIDHATQLPLPFGSLGVHKKQQYGPASVGVFLFDILYLNGKSLLDEPMADRRQLLKTHVKAIPNRVLLSELHPAKTAAEVQAVLDDALAKKLEERSSAGLVVKDVRGVYEPAARHWLKIKKDYLHGMADTADLIVLGAYFGTGARGGIMGTFLMGVLDHATKTFKTVCKVGNGFDDATLDKLNKTLKMVRIDKDFDKVPSWLVVHKQDTPDFVSADPYSAPVWEITGAEFSKSNRHTAAGISIRHPRMTRMRPDKTPLMATSLKELIDLRDASSAPTKGKGAKHSKDCDADDESATDEDEPLPSGHGSAAGVAAAAAADSGSDTEDMGSDDDAGPAPTAKTHNPVPAAAPPSVPATKKAAPGAHTAASPAKASAHAPAAAAAAAAPASAPTSGHRHHGTAPAGSSSAPLKGVHAVLSGYNDVTAAELRGALEALGATVSPGWRVFGAGKTTHLICDSVTPEYQRVRELHGEIVSKRWVLECRQHQTRVPEPAYRFTGPSAAEDADAPEPSGEVLTELLDVFAGSRFVVDPAVRNRARLLRYLIAFDAEVQEAATAATDFYIAEEWTPEARAAAALADTVTVVRPAWVWKCVQQREFVVPLQFTLPPP